MRGSGWTREADEMLRSLAASSATVEQAAQLLRVGVPQIHYRCEVLRLQWNRTGQQLNGACGKSEKATEYVEPQSQPLKPLRTVLTVRARDCRYPIGDPRRKDFGLCGRPRTVLASGKLSSYCATHHEACHDRKRQPGSVPVARPR